MVDPRFIPSDATLIVSLTEKMNFTSQAMTSQIEMSGMHSERSLGSIFPGFSSLGPLGYFYCHPSFSSTPILSLLAIISSFAMPRHIKHSPAILGHPKFSQNFPKYRPYNYHAFSSPHSLEYPWESARTLLSYYHRYLPGGVRAKSNPALLRLSSLVL